MMAARGELFIPVDLARMEAREHQVHDTHGLILKAIRGQDAAAAEQEMRCHIDLVRQLVYKALEASGIRSSRR